MKRQNVDCRVSMRCAIYAIDLKDPAAPRVVGRYNASSAGKSIIINTNADNGFLPVY